MYLPTVRCCSPKTIESYRQAINLFLDFLENKKHIETTQIYLGISREELEKALSKREDVLDYVDLRYKNANGSLRSLI